MKKRILSLILAAAMLFVTLGAMTGCSDKELEAFDGELYCEVLPIKDGKSSIITIVHDDGDYDTVKYMKQQFEKNDLCGSVAMIANRVLNADGTPKENAEDWQKLIKEGNFDVVCHTRTHTWYGFTDDGESGTYIDRDGNEIPYDYAPGHMTDEIVGAAQDLAELFGVKVRCYAIPGFATASGYDGRNQAAKDIIYQNFVAARRSGGWAEFDGVRVEKLNNLASLDYEQLNSYTTLTANDDTDWIAYVDSAIEYNAWGIFLFHCIVNKETDYEYNVSKNKAVRLFSYLGDVCGEDGPMWCATFSEAALYTQEIKTAYAYVDKVDGSGIHVAVTDDLDDEIYDQALTVKVQVMDSWDKAEIEYDGKKYEKPVLTADDGSKYVMVDIIPDRGQAVINKAK